MLVSLVLVSALNALTGVASLRIAAEGSHDGTALARDLMEEILSQHYREPDETIQFGIEASELITSRSAWDDVDDYQGWSASPPRLKNHTVMTGYTGWTRSVNVALVQLSNPGSTTLTDEGLKRIIVTVTAPDGEQTRLTAWRSQWGLLEQSPSADATVQTRAASQIQIGTGATHYSGTALQNHAQDQ